jgi:hypothetical protein
MSQHYGPETYNKNFIYSGDNWLFVERWEHLIAQPGPAGHDRSLDLEYVITSNDDPQPFIRTLILRYLDDYGESHYIGPIEGAQPMSEAWVNGFDHQGTSSNGFTKVQVMWRFAHPGRFKRLARPPTVLHIRVQKRRLP